MPKLYEISNEMAAILSAIAENEGEVTPELEATLKECQIELTEKGESIAKQIQNMKGDQDAFKAESKRLSERAGTIGSKIDWMKNYLKTEMSKANVRDIKGEVFTIRIRPSQPSCIILDEKIIPIKFVRVIPETKEPDKRAIIDFWKAGNDPVPGTEIARGETLTIR